MSPYRFLSPGLIGPTLITRLYRTPSTAPHPDLCIDSEVIADGSTLDLITGRDSLRIGRASRRRDDGAARETDTYTGGGTARKRRVGPRPGKRYRQEEAARKKTDRAVEVIDYRRADQSIPPTHVISSSTMTSSTFYNKPPPSTHSRPVSLRPTSGGPGVDDREPGPEVCLRLGNIPPGPGPGPGPACGVL